MGGKGRKRREKNFRAAHGGNSSLPPPPKSRDLDALPSKLRRIMEFITPLRNPDSIRTSNDVEQEQRKGDAAIGKEANSKGDYGINDVEFKVDDNDEYVTTFNHKDDKDEIMNTKARDKRKAKRKRKAIEDLRFLNTNQELAAIGLKKRDRKKKYLDARKKKNKKGKTDKDLDFPGHEEIRFGDVVQAPPKLAFPKALKTSQDASHQRLRLQAVEAYRNRKGWVSRPGLHLPPITETPSS
ncbi:coiled-coil protein isoform X2 [Tasmannia lanceolata]